MSTEKSSTVADKIEKLEALLAWFESEEITVEQSLKKYEEALKLSQELEKDLKEAKNKVEVIKQNFAS